MLKKTIEYKDFKGNDRKEDFYFNLNEAEIMEMELTVKGGMSTLIQNIIDAEDITQIIPIFKDLILKSYGERSQDGNEFVKIDLLTGAPLYRKFMQTNAYSVLFMELSTDDVKAAEFFKGVIPQTPETEQAFEDALAMKKEELISK